MSITTTEYCIHGRDFVSKEQITWLHLPRGGKRRLCSECKELVKAIHKEKSKAK